MPAHQSAPLVCTSARLRDARRVNVEEKIFAIYAAKRSSSLKFLSRVDASAHPAPRSPRVGHDTSCPTWLPPRVPSRLACRRAAQGAYLRVFDKPGGVWAWLCLSMAKPCRMCGAVGPGAPRPAPPRPDFAPCRGASLSKTRARRHDCHYPPHLSLGGRPRLAQGSLWGAVAAPKASNLTSWSAGRATRWAVRDSGPLGS